MLTNVFDQKLLSYLLDTAFANNGSLSVEIKNMFIGLKLLKFLFNIAVAAWLYFQAKDLRFNRFLWPVFGLLKPSGAIVAFLLILIYESTIKTSSKKRETEAEL